MQEGALVQSKMGTLGVGVVVAVRDDMAFVYFKNQGTPEAKKFRFASLETPATDSDPELQSLKFTGSVETGFTLMNGAKKARAKKSVAAPATVAATPAENPAE